MLEAAREKELTQKGQLPRSTRFTTDVGVLEKVQQDIARRVDETDASSSKTVRLSDETREYSHETMDLANVMKLTLMKVRAKERTQAERAETMANTLLKMGSEAMVGAASVATKSEEALGLPEPTSNAEAGVESDMAEAAREYGTVVNQDAAEKELEDQMNSGGVALGKALGGAQGAKGAKGAKGGTDLSNLSDAHGCVTALGFAWCEGTASCYSVSEPSHCPSTKTRAPAGRVLEVSDCPWCMHDNDQLNGNAHPHHPLFQGLLVHYMKDSETDNLKWVDQQTQALHKGYALRNTTNHSMRLLVEDASESNRLYSTQQAVATLHRMELEHEARGDVDESALQAQHAKQALATHHHDQEVTTEAAAPRLEEPDDKPAPEIIQQMDSQSMVDHTRMMDEASAHGAASADNALHMRAMKEAEATAARAMDTLEARGEADHKLHSSVEHLAAAREQLNLATTEEERQAALAALRALMDALLDGGDGGAGIGTNSTNGTNGTNGAVGEEEGCRATITHGFVLKGMAMDSIHNDLQAFKEAVVKSIGEAVGGLNKVVVDQEGPAEEDGGSEDGGSTSDAIQAIKDDASMVHVSYTVTLKPKSDPQSKAIDLVQVDVKVLTSILEASLQDAGVNVASGALGIVNMDKDTDVQECEEEQAATGATGGGCVNCDTDPDVLAKLSALEGECGSVGWGCGWVVVAVVGWLGCPVCYRVVVCWSFVLTPFDSLSSFFFFLLLLLLVPFR